jgi:NADPH2:quinone reductase
MRHKRVVVAHYGGPEVITAIEEELPTPKAGDVRVKVLAAGVSLPDVLAREGVHPETPRALHAGLGSRRAVDQLGEGVTGFELRQTVAAMPIHGCYAQYLCVPRRKLVPCLRDWTRRGGSRGVELHHGVSDAARSAKAGPTAYVDPRGLGGVGSAMLQLARLAGVRCTERARRRGRRSRELGGIPIDYKNGL